MRRVFKPPWAMAMARLAATAVFPSKGVALVTTIVLIFFSKALNWRFALRDLKLSAKTD
ncbi:hypothetical protein ES703_112703 [subsurface metagenome]